jgi:hypothetical protein
VEGGTVFFRESCFRQSGDKARKSNPTHYRRVIIPSLGGNYDTVVVALAFWIPGLQARPGLHIGVHVNSQNPTWQASPRPDHAHFIYCRVTACRNPRDYFSLFDQVEVREEDGRYAHYELVSCKCVDTYVRIKKNQNQVRAVMGIISPFFRSSCLRHGGQEIWQPCSNCVADVIMRRPQSGMPARNLV